MIVVSRHIDETILIGDEIRVTVASISAEHVVLDVVYLEWGKAVERSCALERDDHVEIPPNAKVRVVEIRGDNVRLAIDAPKEVAVHRKEVVERTQRAPGKVPAAAKPAKRTRSAPASTSVQLALKPDEAILIGEALKVTLTDTDPKRVRVIVDGELIGGPDDGLRIRQAREVALGSVIEAGEQIHVTLLAATEADATLVVACPAHVVIKKS